MRASRLAALFVSASLAACDTSVLHELPTLEEPVAVGGATPDRVVPSFSNLFVSPAFATVGTDVTLSFDSTEPLPAGTEASNPEVLFAGLPMDCEANGLTQSCTFTVSRAQTEGRFGFSIRATDAAGNLGELTPTDEVTLDFTPPVITIAASPDPATIGAALSFSVGSDEPLANDPPPSVDAAFVSGTTSCTGSGTNFTCVGATILATATPGPASFTATARDRAGNEATSAPGAVTLVAEDTTPPGLSNFDATPPFATTGATVTLTFDSTEELPADARAGSPNPEITFGGVAMACRSTGNAHTCTVVADASMVEGAHGFHVVGADATGNTTELAPSDEVTLDFTAPLLTVSASPDPAILGQAITFTVTADEPLDPSTPPVIVAAFLTGAANCLSSGASFTCGAIVSPTARVGVAQFAATGQDRAGNTAGSAQTSVTLRAADITPPAFSNYFVSPAIAGPQATITFRFDATEALPADARAGSPNPEVTFGGAAMQCSSSSLTHTCTLVTDLAMPDGPRSFRILGADATGNLADVSPPNTVTLDFTAPTLLVSGSPNPVTKGQPIGFFVTSNEPLDAFSPPTIAASFLTGTPVCSSAAGGFQCTGASVAAAAPGASGSFTATGRDLAGNEATSAPATVTLLASDLAPPTFSNFSATPSFAGPNATVTLRFDASEALPVDARLPAINPEVTFGGVAMACVANGFTHTCTLATDPAWLDGARSFRILGADATGNLGDQSPPVSVTVDYTPPALTVSATPNPVTKGDPLTFLVTANEPLDSFSPPSIAASFLTGTPSCSGAGNSFSCSGAVVAEAAPGLSGSFTATGRDLAGNTATSAAANVTLVNPVLLPPRLTVGAIGPNPATDGDTLAISFTANQDLVSCEARVSNQLASCSLAGPRTCACSFVVNPTVLEGVAAIDLTGMNANGAGQAATAVQVDRTGPGVDPTRVRIERSPLGSDDLVIALPAGVSDDRDAAHLYAGRAVAEVRLWSQDAGGAPLVSFVSPVLGGDGSIAAGIVPGTDGLTTLTLAHAQLWASAIDLAGNEGPRTELTEGSDVLVPTGDGARLMIVRRPFGELDGLVGMAGALSGTGTPIREARVFDAAVGGSGLGALLPGQDGTFSELSIGSGEAAPGRLWVEVEDKCGFIARVEAEVGADGAAPVVDGNLLTIHRRSIALLDGFEAAAGAITDATSAVREVSWCAVPADCELRLTTTPLGPDGSFAEQPVGTATGSVGQLWVQASDKCGNRSAPVEALVGRDVAPPQIDGTLVSVRSGLPGEPRHYVGLGGAITDVTSVVRELQIYADEGALTLIDTLLPDADGSIPEHPLAGGSAPRIYLRATDKVGNVSAVVPSRGLEATVNLSGRVRNATGGVSASLWSFGADQDRRLMGAGRIPLVAGEASPADTAAAAAIDAARAHLGSLPSSHDDGPSAGWRTPMISALASHSMVFDSNRSRVVLFGGRSPSLGIMGELWEFDGVAWEKKSPAGGLPPARESHAMAYDSVRQRVVVFGGMGRSGVPLNDMWEYDGTSWSHIVALTRPVARSHHSLTFDVARARVILFGGRDLNSAPLSDTWEYGALGWTHVAVGGPSARYGHVLAHDSSRARTVLVGGTPGDTWEYDGVQWSQTVTAGDTPLIEATPASAAFDSARGRVMLCDGHLLWEYDGVAWVQARPANRPPGPRSAALAYDAARAALVLFGGSSRPETWQYANGDWAQFLPPRLHPSAQSPNPIGHFSLTYDVNRSRVVTYGGFWSEVDGNSGATIHHSLRETWEFDGTGWSQVAAFMRAPTPRILHSAAYDAVRGKLVLFGGEYIFYPAPPQLLDDTWEFDGSSWSVVLPATRPPPRSNAGMVFDAARGRTILHGGSGLNDTWTYDGTDWKQLVGEAPPARSGFALAFDATRGKVVLFGGVAESGPLNDTWELDGANWRQVISAPGLAPAAGSGSALAYDTERGRLLLYEGVNEHGALWNMWQLTTNGWILTATTAPELAVADPLMVWDAAHSKLVMVGGDEFYEFGGTSPHSHVAAHAFRVSLEDATGLSALSATWVGAGLGDDGGVSTPGVEFLVWNWTANNWTRLGLHYSLNSASPAARTITASPPAPLDDYVRDGRVWLLATPLYRSSFPPGLIESQLDTDYFELHATMVLP